MLVLSMASGQQPTTTGEAAASAVAAAGDGEIRFPTATSMSSQSPHYFVSPASDTSICSVGAVSGGANSSTGRTASLSSTSSFCNNIAPPMWPNTEESGSDFSEHNAPTTSSFTMNARKHLRGQVPVAQIPTTHQQRPPPPPLVGQVVTVIQQQHGEDETDFALFQTSSKKSRSNRYIAPTKIPKTLTSTMGTLATTVAFPPPPRISGSVMDSLWLYPPPPLHHNQHQYGMSTDPQQQPQHQQHQNHQQQQNHQHHHQQQQQASLLARVPMRRQLSGSNVEGFLSSSGGSNGDAMDVDHSQLGATGEAASGRPRSMSF